MTQYRIHVEDSVGPAPIYERFRFDGIRFYRCTFPDGAGQTYRYPEAIAYKDVPTCHFQVSGRMIEPTGTWPEQGPGWVSREDDFIIPAGVFTRQAATDCVRWCCTGVADGEPTDFVSIVRLVPGTLIEIPQGGNLLLADGELDVGTMHFTGVRRLRAATGPKTAVPTTTGFAFTWLTADVLARYPAVAP